jgi:hypothetical protein
MRRIDRVGVRLDVFRRRTARNDQQTPAVGTDVNDAELVFADEPKPVL